MLKLGIHMDNGIENRTPRSYYSLYLSIFYPVFFVFVYRLFRIRVTVFFATYLLLLLYCSAFLKQCSGAIVRFSDSSSCLSYGPDKLGGTHGRAGARTHAHTPNYNCNNYGMPRLPTSGLNKNEVKLVILVSFILTLPVKQMHDYQALSKKKYVKLP